MIKSRCRFYNMCIYRKYTENCLSNFICCKEYKLLSLQFKNDKYSILDKYKK